VLNNFLKDLVESFLVIPCEVLGGLQHILLLAKY
jgi:hypothetical protein